MIPNLTLSMIVKNEEKYLRGCLESVKDVVDEIVLVDTGSTDNTINIAREFGAKVFHFKWINDFSAARNFALSKSKGTWILYLDADERLEPNSIPELKKIVSTRNKEAVYCLVKSISSKTQKPNIMRYPRLFTNGKKIEFRGSAHEQIIYSLEEKNYRKYNSGIEILHLGYNIDDAGLKEKAKRNLTHLLHDLKISYTAYNLFQISQTYGVLDDKENAKKYYSKVLEEKHLADQRTIFQAHSCRYLAACELIDHNFEKAHKYMMEGLSYDSTVPLLHLIGAKINMGVGNFPAATDYCKNALMHNKEDGSKDFEIYTQDEEIIFVGLKSATLAHDVNSFNYFFSELKKNDKAASKSNAVLEIVNSLFNNIELLQNQKEELKKYIDATNLELFVTLLEKYNYKEISVEFFEFLLESFGDDVQLLNSYGTVLSDIGEFNKAIEILEKSVNIKISNPAIIFFLVSCYVQVSNVDPIVPLIEKAENQFSNVPQVMQKIDLLKKQLLAIG